MLIVCALWLYFELVAVFYALFLLSAASGARRDHPVDVKEPNEVVLYLNPSLTRLKTYECGDIRNRAPLVGQLSCSSTAISKHCKVFP